MRDNSKENVYDPAEAVEEPQGSRSSGTDPKLDEEDQHTLLPFPVVALAAAQGGLEAYIQLFRTLAPNTGMAFVVAPYLSGEEEGQICALLASHTEMPVRLVESDLALEPNHVFVLPSLNRVSVHNGSFRMQPAAAADRVVMPIDHFLRSLAGDQQNRVIGVLLSGAYADGGLGLKAIKGEGGIAIVQDPETARFAEMPHSGILADHVDLILHPSQIGTELTWLARQYFNPSLRFLEQGDIAPHDALNFAKILNLLKSVSGNDFSGYRTSMLWRRVARRMVLRRIEMLADYVQCLQESGEELKNLHEDALFSVTRFFRDPNVFKTLKAEILPQLLKNRPADQQIRIWAPGCSTGEEVYSIAICVLEYFAGQRHVPPIQIFGTDASDRLIEKARTALYPESICAEVSADRLARFFVKTEKGHQISKHIRELCIFSRQNICNDPPFSRVDLISCRNVLTYLQREEQRSVLRTFHYALRSEGWLLLGNSESAEQMPELFKPLDSRQKFYIKQGLTSANAFSQGRGLLAAGQTAAAPGARYPATFRVLESRTVADHVILARYSPPAVVVNADLQVLDVRGRPGPFLAIAPGAPTASILRMAHRDILPVLREGLARAIAASCSVSEQVSVHDDGDRRDAFLEILPLPTGTALPQEFLVAFVPLQQPGTEGPQTYEAVADPQRELARARRDLAATRIYLQSLLEERDTSNQELTAANEELQSTNEELETAKEELQSANEELQTVNEELRDRNIALLAATNDLHNLLNSVNIPVLMLDSDLTVRQFTPPAERLMSLRPVDVGRPIREIRLNLVFDGIESLLQEVLETLVTKEMDVQDRSGRWHLLRVRPYRTADNKIDGLVILLLDNDEARRTKLALEQARDFAHMLLDSMPVPLVVLDSDLRIRSANAAFRSLSKLDTADLEHRSFSELLGLLWKWPDLRPALRALLVEPGPRILEQQHDMESGPKCSFQLIARAVQVDGKEAILAVIEDITMRKQAERVMDAERERLAGEVISTTQVLGRTREELRALAGRLFNSQEEERRRVARELHDDVSQKLAALGMEIDRARQSPPLDRVQIQERLQTFQARASALADEVRDISHRLHPSTIEHLGLPSALKSLVSEFGEREGMVATFRRSNVPETLPLEVAGALYRIAQEALRNVAKHAGRTHVKVALEGTERELTLSIRDFGEGFDMQGGELRGLGFISMSERAGLIGGRLSVNSALGEGTNVSVTVPL